MALINGLITQHMTAAGDGTGTANFNGDYSVTPVYPLIVPPVDEVYEIHSLTIYIEDTGNFDANTYGALAQLTNGLGLDFVSSVTSKQDLVLGDPIKDHGDISHFATKFDTLSAQGAGTSSFVARWNFIESFGEPIVLCGSHLEGLRITLNDNFTGLVEHEFVAYGHRIEHCQTKSTF